LDRVLLRRHDVFLANSNGRSGITGDRNALADSTPLRVRFALNAPFVTSGVTNWMTAAGIAFIAGGLATLISLRSVLFGGGKRRRDRRPAEEAERSSRRPAAAPAERTRRRDAEIPPPTPEDERAGPGGGNPGDDQPDDHAGGLASLGLAAADELADAAAADQDGFELADAAADRDGYELADVALGRDGYELADAALDRDVLERDELEPVDEWPVEVAEDEPEPIAEEPAAGLSITSSAILAHRPPPAEPATDLVTPGDEESRPIPVRRVDRSDRRYGDRVDGWVRPDYQDDPADSPSGEYWTPVPMDDLGFDLADDDPEPSAKGYGWPIQVERLPAVPDYEPATGFDLAPVPAEPTEVVPVWPPVPEDRRIRLPRTWSSRNEKPADNRFLENEAAPRRRKNRDDPDQRFRAPTGEPERRRPRPRPRPGPEPDNVYVSRHAAEPPRPAD
jgi:hypothetical protein